MSKIIEFRYTKSNRFNSSLITGAAGGITTQGLIDVNFFIDKNPTPEKSDIEIDDFGKVLHENYESIDYKEREIAFEALMDINTAKSIQDWIGDKINQLEKLSDPKNENR